MNGQDTPLFMIVGMIIGAVALVVALTMFFLSSAEPMPPQVGPATTTTGGGGAGTGTGTGSSSTDEPTNPDDESEREEPVEVAVEKTPKKTAEAYLAEGRYERAIAVLEEGGLSDDPLMEKVKEARKTKGKRKADRLEIEGDGEARAGNYLKAAAYYRDALDRYRSPALEEKYKQALHHEAVARGDDFLTQGRLNDAIRAYRQALEHWETPETREKLDAALEARNGSK